MAEPKNLSAFHWIGPLAASILLHALLLGGFCTLGWDSQSELSPAVMVELLTPTLSIAATEPQTGLERKKTSPAPQKSKPKAKPQRAADPLNEFRQETIQLNTRRHKYMNYSAEIKQIIYQNWRYPEQARQARMQGQLLLEFSILDSGDLAGIKVLKSSGYASLDQGTIDAINAATPFPPLPEHFQLDRMNIRARFFYRLVAES